MLLVYLLVISLFLLFVFSMSREEGKNTKFARKGANAIAPKKEQETAQSVDTSKRIEFN